MRLHKLRYWSGSGKVTWSILSLFLLAAAVTGLFTVSLSPFRAFGGAIWLKDGIHYMKDADISQRIESLNAPKEALLAESIRNATPSCEIIESGFCQRSPQDYVYKTLTTPAVAYKPGTPDKKEVIGYCTLCNDGTFSPSCAVGRGACSWHDGVAAYNVERYKITPGTPATEARAAIYSYDVRTYKDSEMYTKPSTPELKAVVGF